MAISEDDVRAVARFDVLAEFSEGEVTRYHNVVAMADEIVRLRERVRELEVASAAGVTVTEAMVEAFMAAYSTTEQENPWIFTHRMGITEALKSSLTAAREVQP